LLVVVAGQFVIQFPVHPPAADVPVGADTGNAVGLFGFAGHFAGRCGYITGFPRQGVRLMAVVAMRPTEETDGFAQFFFDDLFGFDNFVFQPAPESFCGLYRRY